MKTCVFERHISNDARITGGLLKGWRLIKDRGFAYLLFSLSFLGILPLLLIVGYVLVKGISCINFDFLFSLPVPVGEMGGGIANAIVGSVVLVFIASLFSIPVGILGGLYLNERRSSKLASWVGLSVEVLQGVPSIVIGIVIWMWVVLQMGHFSALAGGVALGVMMLPTVVKSTEETVRLVPESIREGVLALGIPYYKLVLRVLLPMSKGGILTGVLLGVARVAGETAPLLFTAFGNPYFSLSIVKPIASLPLVIFNYATSPYEEWHRMAWGASLILIVFVLVLNLSARFFVSENSLKKVFLSGEKSEGGE